MYEMFERHARRSERFEELRSTNTYLKERIYAEKSPLFLKVTSAVQSAGRGRQGRTFLSPSGGLYMSLSYPLCGDETNISFLTLLAGLSVSRAIDALCGTKTQIKWPNDIYLNSMKLCGILTELVSGACLTAVVGIGINLTAGTSDIPDELKDKATSLYLQGFEPPDAEILSKKITEYLDAYVYGAGELYSATDKTTEEITLRSYSIGKTVSYNDKDGLIYGTVTGIEKNGAARIRLSDGTERTVFSGELV